MEEKARAKRTKDQVWDRDPRPDILPQRAKERLKKHYHWVCLGRCHQPVALHQLGLHSDSSRRMGCIDPIPTDEMNTCLAFLRDLAR